MITWYDGDKNYRKNTLELGENNKHTFTVELNDVEIEDRPINQIFHDYTNRHIEVLYSGGLDSELILRSCRINKTPVTAVTMRLMLKGAPINTHDLYYAEKFCRENYVDHKIIDLDVGSFYENGTYLDYLVPYYIDEPHVATHFWLFEQCTKYPVIGGDYSWPWVLENVISPHRISYNSYNLFLSKNSISGVGNMLGNSLESNILLMKTQRRVFNADLHGNSIHVLKHDVFNDLGVGNFELRMRSYGWELGAHALNKTHYKIELLKRIGYVKPVVKWGQKIQDILGPSSGVNDRF